MRYHVRNPPPHRPSTVVTCDEKVVWSTPAYSWAVGLTLNHVLLHAERNGLPIVVVGQEFAPPSTIERMKWGIGQ